jgi:UDP-glucuronate decarboxylase
LGNPVEVSIRELAEIIRDMIGSSSRIIHRPLPVDDPLKRRPDITEAERALGWRPTISLKEGLSKTIPYFEGLLAEGKMPHARSLAAAESVGGELR